MHFVAASVRLALFIRFEWPALSNRLTYPFKHPKREIPHRENTTPFVWSLTVKPIHVPHPRGLQKERCHDAHWLIDVNTVCIVQQWNVTPGPVGHWNVRDFGEAWATNLREQKHPVKAKIHSFWMQRRWIRDSWRSCSCSSPEFHCSWEDQCE